jgi:chromosome segregation ATPase
MQAELTAVSKENKKLVEAKNALDRVARERAAATEKIEKNIDVYKGKAAAAAAAAAAADAKTKQSLQAQAEMQAALAEAKKETAAAKADAAAATKKLEALDRKRALGDSEFAVLETEAMDDNPEALKHKYEPQTNLFTDSTPQKHSPESPTIAITSVAALRRARRQLTAVALPVQAGGAVPRAR